MKGITQMSAFNDRFFFRARAYLRWGAGGRQPDLDAVHAKADELRAAWRARCALKGT